MTTADFYNGMCLKVDGAIYELVYFQHVKPGKGGAFVRTRLKHIEKGNVLEKTFRAGETIEAVRVEDRKGQFLYQQGTTYCFMDSHTYEQMELEEERVAEIAPYLKEGQEVYLVYADEKFSRVKLPPFVELQVAQTDPGLKGDTAAGGSKPAKLETGAVIQVPLFIQPGDLLKIDTRTGSYIERVRS